MKRLISSRAAAMILLLLAVFCGTAAAETAAEPAAEPASEKAAWTVMIYLCGSDLESQYSFATGNLQEIAAVHEPENQIGTILTDVRDISDLQVKLPGQVHILLETGGSSEWHAQALGMEIKTDCLQDWEYIPGKDGGNGAFQPLREKPLASMAESGTLAEFISWSQATCPAEKYALILWDHGGGSKTGLFIDELFSGDYMALDELRDALTTGGVHFEAIVFDACMMANIETACAVQDYASWMIASQETVPAKGTAVGDWLQELLYVTDCDGRTLGRWVCDMTQIKFANEEDEQSRELMTWSVIDLSKIKRLEKNFDKFFEGMNEFYVKYPLLISSFVRSVFHTEQYGNGTENMVDLAGILYEQSLRSVADESLQWEMQDALAEAVDYCLRGAGRPAARGISFCYATNFTVPELEVYARNCPSQNYLALLDAISPWTAPEEVYQTVQKLPELAEIQGNTVTIHKTVCEDGSPGFTVEDANRFLGAVTYNLYREDQETGQTISLGLVPAYYDPETGIYQCRSKGEWAAIDGNLCHLEMLNIPLNGNYDILFNIPISVDARRWNLRSGFRWQSESFEVYGLWQGFNADNQMFNRNSRPISSVTGQEYYLIYPVVSENGTLDGDFEPSAAMNFQRIVQVEKAPLPPGNYEMEYVLYDIFIRPARLERVKLTWDGTAITMADPSAWQGDTVMDIASYYEQNQTNFSIQDVEKLTEQ